LGRKERPTGKFLPFPGKEGQGESRVGKGGGGKDKRRNAKKVKGGVWEWKCKKH